jgi:hypothetical protein
MAGETEKKDSLSDKVDEAAKSVGLIEKMGCACLNLGCLFLVLGVLSIIAMIVGVMVNPLEALKAILGNLWCTFGLCK